MVTAQNNSSVRATTGGRRHESTAERRQRDLGTPATRPNRDNAGQRTDEEKRRAATVERRSGEANSRRPMSGTGGGSRGAIRPRGAPAEEQHEE
jgi:hypothetical protein